MQCNIDAKGKFARLIWGLFMLALACLLAGVILLDIVPGGWVWVGVFLLAALGAFGIYEARAGWCVARAMGFKTKW